MQPGAKAQDTTSEHGTWYHSCWNLAKEFSKKLWSSAIQQFVLPADRGMQTHKDMEFASIAAKQYMVKVFGIVETCQDLHPVSLAVSRLLDNPNVTNTNNLHTIRPSYELETRLKEETAVCNCPSPWEINTTHFT